MSKPASLAPAGAIALALVAGCITSSAGPTTVDVYNAGADIVKVHVLFNTTSGAVVEQQVFVVGPANVDEKNVAMINVSGTLRVDAFTESGLHAASPLDVTMTGATVSVNVTASALQLRVSHG